MTSPMITECLILRLPYGDIMLAFDKGMQFDPFRPLRLSGRAIEDDFHPPVITHRMVAFVFVQIVAFLVLAIKRTAQKDTQVWPGKRDFPAGALFNHTEQRRANAHPFEFRVDIPVSRQRDMSMLVIEFFKTYDSAIGGF